MIEQILEERGNRYGEFAEHARITQEIKDTLVSGQSWDDCSDSQREALEMIAHKLGRIVNGDPDYDDSWIDIIGYSQLIIDEIQEDSTEDEVPIADVNWESLGETVSNLLDNAIEELNNIAPIEEEPTNDDIQEIEINGIRVFISGSELEKLTALKESEDISEPKDHPGQSFMDFNLEDELTYQEFLDSHKEQK